jgi:LysR family transcriptional regulator, low CO2-responsive transcriptional regulator
VESASAFPLLRHVRGRGACAVAPDSPIGHRGVLLGGGQQGDKDSVKPALYDARNVTLNQLKVFVLAVRLGSLRAAANALGISEPAVSQAIGALRESLGDPLIERAGGVLTLTPAGQRVVGLASQMVNLAVATEEAVRVGQGAPDLLRVVASADVGDAVAPALLEAFNRRTPDVETTLAIAGTREMGVLLTERLADVALGPALAGTQTSGVVSEPLLRYRLLLVTGTDHVLQSNGGVSRHALRNETWLVDPSGTDPLSDTGRLLADLGVAEDRVRVFPTQAAAWAAAATSGGVAPAIEQLWKRDPHADARPLKVPGMPVELLWHINTLHGDRRSATASRLHRFLATPDATQAMFRADGGVPASQFRPPVYVSIWS